jgi:hypothetical protein
MLDIKRKAVQENLDGQPTTQPMEEIVSSGEAIKVGLRRLPRLDRLTHR